VCGGVVDVGWIRIGHRWSPLVMAARPPP
jgi:hypothetical protein